MRRDRNRTVLWIARFLIAAVTVMNIQAAFQFMLRPQDFAPGFEMTGAAGEAMLQGMGLLFLMWNIPYVFAAVQPVRNFVSLIEAVIMQCIGVCGETLLLLGLPGEHPVLEASVRRFILFDGAGLVVLFVTLVLIITMRRSRVPRPDGAGSI